MQPTLVTFLGGPWDLHRVSMTDAPLFYDVPVLAVPPTVSSVVNPEGDMSIALHLRKAQYRRYECYSGEMGKVVIYLYDRAR